MKTLIATLGFFGLFISIENIDFVAVYNSTDTLPQVKREKKKSQTSIYMGLRKGYSTFIICECKDKKNETEVLVRKELESKGIKIITQDEYQQKHKEASEIVLKQAMSGGAMSSLDDIQEKLKNYQHNIQVITLYTTFKESFSNSLSSLQWKIRHEPPQSNPVKRSFPDSLIVNNNFAKSIQLLCDSLISYSK